MSEWSFFQVFLNLWPIIQFQLDQFLNENLIFILLSDCIFPLCNRGVFSPMSDPTILLASWRDTFLVFYYKYFLFFFYRCHKILSKLDGLVCNLDTWFLLSKLPLSGPSFTTLGTCQLSSASFSEVSIFFIFEVPQSCWDIIFNPLKTIADLHLLGNMRLIKCQDICPASDNFFRCV